MFLRPIDPMRIYQVLFAFKGVNAPLYIGDPGTRAWSQGFPLTTRLPDGPELPETLPVSPVDRMYPKADGHPELREAIATYYKTFYGADITPDNVMIFAGGRPGILTTLLLLRDDIKVLVEETEYTPYWDKLRLLDIDDHTVPSGAANKFRPAVDDYLALKVAGERYLFIRSNPCNPTGVHLNGDSLESLVRTCTGDDVGAIFDEAYEFFADPQDSALRYVENIDETNIFVTNAATKGLQVPGFRLGWVVASKAHIELMRNYSSFGIGGVNNPTQRAVAQMLDIERVTQARRVVASFYASQRQRYGEALDRLGIELFTGDGGFYHWGRLPGGLTADEFNTRLFAHKAAILPGRLCDMNRGGRDYESPLNDFMRFSFGPLQPAAFESDVEILRQVLT